MRKSLSKSLFASLSCAVLLGSGSLAAHSQQVVHALTGTVSSVNSAAKTMTVFQDNGSTGTFDQFTGAKSGVAFDKKLAQATTEAGAFTEQGAYAIIFFVGVFDHPNVVAVKPLGKGPFASAEGTVTNFSGHDHVLSVSDQSGAVTTFKLTPESVAEGGAGAVEASRLQIRKGDHVRVVSTTVDGAPTALFIKDI